MADFAGVSHCLCISVASGYVAISLSRFFCGWSALAAGSLACMFFPRNHLYSALEVREEHEIVETVEAALRGGRGRFGVGVLWRILK